MSNTTQKKVTATRVRAKKAAALVQVCTAPTLIEPRTLIPGATLPGGIFAGFVYPKGVVHALILGPEHKGEMSWNDATAWAKELTVDGLSDFTLMSRPEGSVAYANLPNEFKPAWYWLGEQHASYSDYAYTQLFGYGNQSSWCKGLHLRARAFRRLAI